LLQEFISYSASTPSIRIYGIGSLSGSYAETAVVVNAKFGSSVWTKDQATRAATKYTFANSQIKVQHRSAATTGTWGDLSWDYDQIWTDNATSTLSNKGTIYGAAGPISNINKTLQAFGREVSGNLASVTQERWLVSEDGLESSLDGGRKYKIRRYIRFLNSEIREETAFNARWDGSLWNRDDPTASNSLLCMKTTDGRERIFRHLNVGATWSDSVSAGNWDAVSFDSNRAPRACGYITLANNGTSVATAQNATAAPSGNDVVVTFTYPMPSSSYGVILSFSPSSALTNNEWPVVPRAITRLTTGFTISAHKGDLALNTVSAVNLANDADAVGVIDFAVFCDGVM
jgi:hypothetical protein